MKKLLSSILLTIIMLSSQHVYSMQFLNNEQSAEEQINILRKQLEEEETIKQLKQKLIKARAENSKLDHTGNLDNNEQHSSSTCMQTQIPTKEIKPKNHLLITIITQATLVIILIIYIIYKKGLRVSNLKLLYENAKTCIENIIPNKAFELLVTKKEKLKQCGIDLYKFCKKNKIDPSHKFIKEFLELIRKKYIKFTGIGMGLDIEQKRVFTFEDFNPENKDSALGYL